MASYVNDKALKEYAYKCFNNEPGYSLEKARLLAPDYYKKIAAYYTAYNIEFKTRQAADLARKAKVNMTIIRNFTLINSFYTKLLSSKVDEVVVESFVKSSAFTRAAINAYENKRTAVENKKAVDNIVLETNKELEKIMQETNLKLLKLARKQAIRKEVFQELSKNLNEIKELQNNNISFMESKLDGKQ